MESLRQSTDESLLTRVRLLDSNYEKSNYDIILNRVDLQYENLVNGAYIREYTYVWKSSYDSLLITVYLW
jgi:hypothetical protein